MKKHLSPVVAILAILTFFVAAAGRVEASDPPVSILGSWISGTTHTKESGSNRAFVVIAHAEGSGTSSPTLNTVTYGTRTMTKITDRVQTSGSSTRAYVGAFIFNEADVNLASSTTISATWGGSPTSTSLTSVFLRDVNQAALYGAYASNGLNNTQTITTSALATKNGDMVIEGGTNTQTGTIRQTTALPWISTLEWLVPFLKIKYRFCHSRESGNPLKIRDLCKASIIKSYITFLETALVLTGWTEIKPQQAQMKRRA